MPWTADITSKTFTSSRDVQITVTYTDGTSSTFVETYRATSPDILTETIKNRLAALTAADAAIANIKTGPVTIPPADPIDPILPNPKESLFNSALSRVRVLTELVQLNILDANDANLATAIIDARKNYDPTFV